MKYICAFPDYLCGEKNDMPCMNPNEIETSQEKNENICESCPWSEIQD